MEQAQDNRQVATEALASVIGAAPKKRLTISDLGQVIGRLLPFGTDFAEHFGCGRLHDFLKDNKHFAVDGYGAKNNKVVRLTKNGRVLKAHHITWPLVLPLRQEIPMKIPPSGSDVDDKEDEDQWNTVKGVRSMKGSKGDKGSVPLDPDLALEELLLRHMRNLNPHLGYSLDQVAVPLVQHARLHPKHMLLREWLKLRREVFMLKESNVCLNKKYIEFERRLRADLVSIMRHLNRPAHMRHDLHRFCNLTDVAMTVMKLASFLRSNPHVFRLEHGWVFLHDHCCRAAPPLNTVEEAIECLRTGLPPQHHSLQQGHSADGNGTEPASQGVWADAVAQHGGRPDSRRGSYQGDQPMDDPVAQLEQDIVSLLLREGPQTTSDIATFVFTQHDSLVPVQWDASKYAANNKQLFTVNGDVVDLTAFARKQYGGTLGEALADLGQAAYEGTPEQMGGAGSIADQPVAIGGGHAEADVNSDAHSDTTGTEGRQGSQGGTPASGRHSAPAQQASADALPQSHGSDIQQLWVPPQHTAPLGPPTHQRAEQPQSVKQQLQQPHTQPPETAVLTGHQQGSPPGLSPLARHQPPVPVEALRPTVSLGNFQPGGGFVLSEAAQRATPATVTGADRAELTSLRTELCTGMKAMQSLETQNQALSRRCANLEDEVQTLRVGLAEVRQHILLKQQPQQHQQEQQQPQLLATPAHVRQEPIQKAPSRSNKIYICGGCSEASWQWGALSCTPSSGEWGALPDMPGIHAFGASASVGQTLYVVGGSTTGSQEDWSSSVISCDTAAPSPSWVTRAPMQAARGSLAAAVVHNTIYTMGGVAGQQHLSVCEGYDVDANRWVACPAMLSRRYALAAAMLQDCIFAMGGVDGDRCLNTTERFDPREGRWQMLDSPMRQARGHFACAALDSQLYAIGGTGADAVMADVEVLDIRKMQWQSVAPLSAPRTFGSAVALDSTIFAVGGFQSCLKDLRPVLEAYQPSTNTWSLLNTDHASPPAKRAFFTACVA